MKRTTPRLTVLLLASVAAWAAPAKAQTIADLLAPTPQPEDTIIGPGSVSCESHNLLKQTPLYDLNKDRADGGLMHGFRSFMSGYNRAVMMQGGGAIDLKRISEDPLGVRQVHALKKIDEACLAHPDKDMADIFLMVIEDLNAED